MHLLRLRLPGQVPLPAPQRVGEAADVRSAEAWMITHPLVSAAFRPLFRNRSPRVARATPSGSDHKNTPLGTTPPQGVMSASHGLRFREALRFVNFMLFCIAAAGHLPAAGLISRTTSTTRSCIVNLDAGG